MIPEESLQLLREECNSSFAAMNILVKMYFQSHSLLRVPKASLKLLACIMDWFQADHFKISVWTKLSNVPN